MSSMYAKIFSVSMMVAALGLTACGNNTAQNTPASGSAAAPSDAPAGKTIRFATEGAYPPFNKTNPDGSLTGFDVDVANALCAQLEAKCEIVAQDWDGIIPGLIAKKYDAVIAGMSVTPERQQAVDFTDPYFVNNMVWLAKPGFDTNNITGKKLGSQRSTTPGAYAQENFDKKNGNTVQLYDTYDNAYLDLKSGRTDAVLAEKVTAAVWLKDNPEFAILGEMNNNDNIAVAVRKDDPLKAELNTALATIKSNGELAKLQQANFGQ